MGYPRYAIVVTKGSAVLGSVQRNRIRRMVYAALKNILTNTTMGVDVVLFLRAAPERIRTQDTLSHLHSLISTLETKMCGTKSAD